jgi:hypothetical protein
MGVPVSISAASEFGATPVTGSIVDAAPEDVVVVPAVPDDTPVVVVFGFAVLVGVAVVELDV